MSVTRMISLLSEFFFFRQIKLFDICLQYIYFFRQFFSLLFSRSFGSVFLSCHSILFICSSAFYHIHSFIHSFVQSVDWLVVSFRPFVAEFIFQSHLLLVYVYECAILIFMSSVISRFKMGSETHARTQTPKVHIQYTALLAWCRCGCCCCSWWWLFLRTSFPCSSLFFFFGCLPFPCPNDTFPIHLCHYFLILCHADFLFTHTLVLFKWLFFLRFFLNFNISFSTMNFH